MRHLPHLRVRGESRCLTSRIHCKRPSGACLGPSLPCRGCKRACFSMLPRVPGVRHPVTRKCLTHCLTPSQRDASPAGRDQRSYRPPIGNLTRGRWGSPTSGSRVGGAFRLSIAPRSSWSGRLQLAPLSGGPPAVDGTHVSFPVQVETELVAVISSSAAWAVLDMAGRSRYSAMSRRNAVATERAVVPPEAGLANS
ncbi:hypothetical protein ABH994_003647 [Bradyrhizobium yuanmingense]